MKNLIKTTLAAGFMTGIMFSSQAAAVAVDTVYYSCDNGQKISAVFSPDIYKKPQAEATLITSNAVIDLKRIKSAGGVILETDFNNTRKSGYNQISFKDYKSEISWNYHLYGKEVTVSCKKINAPNLTSAN